VVVKKKCDVLILGAGVIGLAIGIALLQARPKNKVIIAEKEKNLGFHASGRNSGVLHAGFYYSPDSLKAKFCRDGNRELRLLAKKYSIPIRDVGKVVVTRNSGELTQLDTLFRRGIANGVELELRDARDLTSIEPLAVTREKFIWSPTTGVSDSISIIGAMREEFISLGGEIQFRSNVKLVFQHGSVRDSLGEYEAGHIINASGAQADKVSRLLGVGVEYAMLPFMGVYRSTEVANLPLQRLVYPVPHPINPFLGVHFTLTCNDKVKIGPTAIPIAGREQYSLWRGWSTSDIGQAAKGMASLIRGEEHDFGAMVKAEWPKMIQSMLVKASKELVPRSGEVSKWARNPPGIRAQLVHLPTGKLEQDFVIRDFANTTHILNAVSPGWTSALPFGRFIAKRVLEK